MGAKAIKSQQSGGGGKCFFIACFGANLGSERAYLEGDNLSSDMTRDSEQAPFLPAGTAPVRLCRPFEGASRVPCTAYLFNQPAAFDARCPWVSWVYTESRWS